jgi:hypothetical protein
MLFIDKFQERFEHTSYVGGFLILWGKGEKRIEENPN